ncbi:hypothetical protein [Acidithiobacillus ferriphilus]|nr:hypothetical protein [Acidithiobacillus ferriphilus]
MSGTIMGLIVMTGLAAAATIVVWLDHRGRKARHKENSRHVH